MAKQKEIPPPIRKMLQRLDFDIEQNIEMMPKEMEEAMHGCLMCEVFQSCDYNLEGNYYVCPNRDFFERLRRFVH